MEIIYLKKNPSSVPNYYSSKWKGFCETRATIYSPTETMREYEKEV